MSRSEEERLQIIVDREALSAEVEKAAHIGSWTWYVPENLVYWSGELFQILGLDRNKDRASTQAFMQAIHPEDRSAVEADSHRVSKANNARSGDIRIVRPSGEVRIVRLSSSRVAANGELSERVVGTVLDITEMRKQEAALRLISKRLNEAQELAKVGSWVWDLPLDKVEWSDQLYRICGKAKDKFTPTRNSLLSLIHEEDIAKVNASINESLLGESSTNECRLRLDDGTIRYAQVETRIAESQGGKPSIVHGTILDITNRRVYEIQQRQSQKMEALGNLSGGMAHDFNNYMQVISANMEFLCESLPTGDGELRQAKKDIFASLGLCSSLTAGLLAFSRQQDVERHPTDLHQIIRRSLKLIERLLGVGVKMKLALNAEESTVSCDPNQIEQLMFNLAINARDAMRGRGTLFVSTRLVDNNEKRLSETPRPMNSTSTDPCLLLQVGDTGHGMNEKVCAQIFDPFFTTKPAGHGTGLGLSTVYGIVQQCDGSISVESKEGNGACFSIHFPLSQPKPASLPVPRLRTNPPENENQTILVVEDEVMVQRAIVRILSHAGFRVLKSGNGQEALLVLRSIESPAIDIILSDLIMPVVNGAELIGELEVNGNDIPLLLMTGHADDKQINLESIAGYPILRKPFSPHQLLDALKALLAPTTCSTGQSSN